MILTEGVTGLNYRVGGPDMRPFDLFVFICNLKSHFCVRVKALPNLFWLQRNCRVGGNFTQGGVRASNRKVRKHCSRFFLVYGFGRLVISFSKKKKKKSYTERKAEFAKLNLSFASPLTVPCLQAKLPGWMTITDAHTHTDTHRLKWQAHIISSQI